MRNLTSCILLLLVSGSVFGHTPGEEAPLLVQLTHSAVSPHHTPFALLLLAVAVTGIILASRSTRRHR
jgi:hypothetical protein